MDNWFFLEAGERRGPVDLPQLMTVLLASSDARRVRVWREGMSGWQHVEALPELSAKLPPPGPSIAAIDSGVAAVTFVEANAIARVYRRVVYLVLAQLAFVVLSNVLGGSILALGPFLVLVILGIALVVNCYRLNRKLGRAAVLRAIGMFIPVIALVVLWRISKDAQAWCARYGIDVGFMGPTKASLEKLRQAALAV